ncbi:putative F-box/FBD/LRR-repeat protein At5g22670 [Cornus florida]|uniref:putative F-box/FBD/LRR-repeat protein At5g22670 n=1 Tax=Cornus florida TaxID=4283 RepID=UPI0028A024F1|nr:putative F-box/FBD/LRR-repeat protein At5g22670 [Cornus florida]
MASISNHEGSSKQVKNYFSKGDRISNLPDSLIVHILSFLPTKYAVQTSILSSRWKHIWASVPALDFDVNLRFFPVEISNSSKSYSNFMSFVDRVLFNHELSCIQKFRLSCVGYKRIDLSRIYTWISIAIKRGVEELDIQIESPQEHLDLPLSLFTCPTLVVLKLGKEVRFNVPCSAHFRSLKILHLSIEYLCDDLAQNHSAQNLFRNCPVLEDLFMEGIVPNNNEELVFDISTPTMKRLGLKFTAEDFLENGGTKIVVNAPTLEYLTLQDDCLPCFVLSNLTSLVKADFIDVGYYWMKSMQTRKHADRVLVNLREILRVKYLSLGASTMRVLDHADGGKPLLFPNLIRLELFLYDRYDLGRVLDLLKGMPKLVHLVLDKFKRLPRKDFKFVEPEVVPCCLSMHLQKIEFSGFAGLGDELELMAYFLRNAKVLRKMKIHSWNSQYKQERVFLQELAKFPRGSTCQILFC